MTDELINLPELPKGWVWTPLGDIVETVEMVSPRMRPDEEFVYIDIASIDNKEQKIVQPKRYLGKEAPSRARQLIKSGDILFSTVRTYLKNIAMVSRLYDRQIASTGFTVIRPPSSIANKLVFYWVQTDALLNQLTQTQRGTSYPAVRDSDVLAQLFPLPPLPEQNRIVAKIEELFTRLDAGVEALKKTKAQVKRYRQAALKHAFEGKLTAEWHQSHQHELEPASVLLDRIKQERRKTAKGKYKEVPPPDNSNLPELPESWVWVCVGIAVEKIPLSGKKLKQSEYQETGLLPVVDQGQTFIGGYTDRRELRAPCVPPVVIFGDHTKVIKYVNFDFVAGADGVKAMKPLNMFYRKLFYYFLQAIELPEKGYARHFQFLERSFVPVPPLPEQHRIVEEIERRFSVADQLGKTIDHSLKQAERLRHSILKRAFEGKLVPQDPNDEPAEKLLEGIRQERARQQAERKPARSSRNKSNTKQMGLV